jgi:hypothetical protein
VILFRRRASGLEGRALRRDHVDLDGTPVRRSPVPPHIPAGGREAIAGLRPGIHAMDASHVRRDFRLCAKAGIEACRHRGNCGALRLGHVESGVDVDLPARTPYPHHQPAPAPWAVYAFSQTLPYAMYNRITTLSH